MHEGYSAGKIMEFDLLISDISIKVICKFEKLIYKKDQYIKHYVRFAFLLVQTLFELFPLWF